jgi:hypothetical protein
MKTLNFLPVIIFLILTFNYNFVFAQTEQTKRQIIERKHLLKRTESEIANDSKKYGIEHKLFYKDGHVVDGYSWLLFANNEYYNETINTILEIVNVESFFREVKTAKSVKEIIKLIDNNGVIRKNFFEYNNPQKYLEIRKRALNGELAVVMMDDKPHFFLKADIEKPALKKRIQRVLPLD